ncbi:MAG: outer membrane protein assembly factor BamA [Candidatus Aminicenantes bacterium]|nr:outer membrane protein assembly factor BamA [Candidatus Aminicenantes bacterium]
MKRILSALALLASLAAAAGAAIVDRIEVVGNKRISRETVLYYLSCKEGDSFNEEILRRDFRILWSTGFFADIKIEADDSPSGKVVRIIVEENPVVKTVRFRGGKKLKDDDIVGKLKEKDLYPLPYTYITPAKIHKIKSTIASMFVEKGLSGGEVRAALRPVAGAAADDLGLVVRIKEGPRNRVGQVVFEGDLPLPSDVLASAMKDNKAHGLLSWVGGKDIFKADKLHDDLDRVRNKLREKGYMEAAIGEPRIEEAPRLSVLFKKQPMKRLVIPVRAGERYTVGEVRVEGSQRLAAGALRAMVGLEPGRFYSSKRRDKAVEKIGELYRNFGYLYAQIVPVETLDPKGKTVRLVFNVQEGEPTVLNRLEFRGNLYTKDKVIRREFLMREGDRFSLALFKDSVTRIKQLGLVDLEKEPEIKPSAEDLNRFDVTVNVKELQRNNIQFSAGYSGYEGTFLALSYSTVNLLGTGESLELAGQFGKRVKNYSFGFTEPYVLDKPVSLGLNVFKRSIYYPNLFSQDSRGVNYNAGVRVRGFWMTSLSYAYEYMDVGSAPIENDDETASEYNPYYYGGAYGYGHYYVGSLSATFYRNTVDSPLTPTRGMLMLAGCKVAGGILGGEIEFIKPQFEWTYYHPLLGNNVLGLHAEYQFIKSTGGSSVPFWERFYLGGERSIRGYEIYQVGPRSDAGYNTGGEKSLVLNAEYHIPFGGPLTAILFYDAGNAFARRETVSLANLYTSAGLELRMFVPALRVPFRLIFAWNNERTSGQTSNFAFRFAVGSTF